MLTIACRRTRDVESGELSITRDCSDQSTNHKDPAMQLHIRESALRYCYRLNDELTQFVDGKSDPHFLSMLLDPLSRALDAPIFPLRQATLARNYLYGAAIVWRG